MLKNIATIFFCALALSGCADPGSSSLTITTTINEDEGKVSALTPSISIFEMTREDVVGAPYILFVFEGGASAGTDLALFTDWGVVPESLTWDWTTPPELADGPYDIAVIVYTHTDVTTEQLEGDLRLLPMPAGGDLAAFSSDNSVVLEGDPQFDAGFLRVNIEGGDAVLDVQNRIPDPPDDPNQLAAATRNTLMSLP